jgi:diguanylate cyclase (GGDEF)-like protein/PAS domain S-box-containing protein
LPSNTSARRLPFLSQLPRLQRHLRWCVLFTCVVIAFVVTVQSSGFNKIEALSVIVLLAIGFLVYNHDGSVELLDDPFSGQPLDEFTTDVLDDRNGLFRRVFDQAAGMALVDRSGRWLTVNRSLCDGLGYSKEELLAKSFSDVAHPDDLAATLVQTQKVLEGHVISQRAETRFIHKLGHVVWMLLNVSVVNDLNSKPLHFIFQFQDITYRKMEEERLVHDVFHDALTGLPNRALFMDRLKLALERARRRKDQVFAVLFLDLDGFKAVNDSMGHVIGDQLLIKVSRRLTACLRTTDTIARLAGDEFTILLEDLSDEREALRIVERLQKELQRSCKLGPCDVPITASIGITSSSFSYERAEEMLRDADMAMYRAKASGKACCHMFERGRYGSQVDADNLAADLKEAVAREELLLHYQPIVSLETGKLCAFEALVRWQHPALGLILPSDFIPLAEETGAIIEIGSWVLREACFQLKQWQDKFPQHTSLAVTVNLSCKQFLQPDLIDRVIDILQETSINPHSLKLEITESAVMENIGTATILLQQLRALGIELAIDDFGTGYSSLSYLQRLPINSLKIDKSFVKGMIEKRDHIEIVKTILTLARSLGIRVIAEGVETLEQLVELRALHCDAGQGFLFSKPVDVETAEHFTNSRNQWQATVASLGSKEHERPRALEIVTNGLNTAPARRAMLKAV